MGLIAAGISDIGLKRKVNQDSIFLNPFKKIFIVADGMGGHEAGEVASQIAVERIAELLEGDRLPSAETVGAAASP